jgi:hypothetical protein
MPDPRQWTIDVLKRLVWRLMRSTHGAKLLRLAAEERSLFLHDQILTRIGPDLVRRLGSRVHAGPFAGLEYPELKASSSALFPKILGSYEAELHSAIERLIARGYPTVVNVGAGEGYYAVGLACRIAEATVHAYETDPLAREHIAAMASVNRVADRVIVRGHCTIGDLAAFPGSGPALLLMDCEGCEWELIDPQRVPQLASWDVLCELHTARGADPFPVLSDRLLATHSAHWIAVQPRDPDAYPALQSYNYDERVGVLSERTSDAGWALFLSNGLRSSESREGTS